MPRWFFRLWLKLKLHVESYVKANGWLASKTLIAFTLRSSCCSTIVTKLKWQITQFTQKYFWWIEPISLSKRDANCVDWAQNILKIYDPEKSSFTCNIMFSVCILQCLFGLYLHYLVVKIFLMNRTIQYIWILRFIILFEIL